MRRQYLLALLYLLPRQKYFQSGRDVDTNLVIEWTNQHGCGGNENNDPHKLNCNIVIQYMVQDYDGNQGVTQALRFERLRNGRNTQTQNYQSGNLQEQRSAYLNRRNNVQVDRGLHESFDYYDDCYTRTRNTGLFTADQRLRTNNFRVSSAIYTRQNPNGNRRGYECPEERDYYPYWHPSPWRDIAVLTDNVSLCNMYETESFNVKPRQRCREFFDAGRTQPKPRSVFNNETGCTQGGGVWFTEYAHIDTEEVSQQECQRRNNTDGYMRMWAPKDVNQASECLVLPNAPACMQGGWTRVNHLGNGRDGVPLNITWRIPYFPSNTTKLAVLRVRYNISTDDYHPWLTNSSYNDNPGRGIRSPIQQNPNVDIGSTTNKPLRLAINTAQFGRTFQDRSHVMVLRPRTDLPAGAARDCTIHNLNVRGKRGNIVQVYPSVEYDFVPNRLNIPQSDCLHVQWTGSNTHNNGPPGGDGQTGDAGEGTGGTDRQNIVEIPDPNSNYPLPWANSTLFRNAEALWTSWDLANLEAEDLAVAFASAGFYQCYRDKPNCDNSVQSPNGNTELQRLLNNAPASFEGALIRFRTTGTYHYICSRNNNFTNRSQKGQITVRPNNK